MRLNEEIKKRKKNVAPSQINLSLRNWCWYRYGRMFVVIMHHLFYLTEVLNGQVRQYLSFGISCRNLCIILNSTNSFPASLFDVLTHLWLWVTTEFGSYHKRLKQKWWENMANLGRVENLFREIVSVLQVRIFSFQIILTV